MIEQDDMLERLGAVARSIGEPDFYVRLLELAGAPLPHQMSWIVRYGPTPEPDVLHTKRISAGIVEYYLQAEPDSNDPYFCSWRGNGAARVETMEAALPQAIDRDFYPLDFMKRMEFTDEIALFLPAPGSSCLSLFLERRTDRFTASEIARIERLFPVLLDLHRTHIRSLLSGMAGALSGQKSIDDGVASVFDRNGRLVSATPGWREMEQSLPLLRDLGACGSDAEIREVVDGARLPLNLMMLDEMNPFAPGGVIVQLATGRDDQRGDALSAADIVGRLTPRERDIMALTLEAMSTGAIAQQLGIAKGSIKNCRLRMYRKFGVASERELIALMNPVAKDLVAQLGEGRREAAPA